MRTFGGFKHGDETFFGEVRGEEVHRLTSAPWLGIKFSGTMLRLDALQIDLPVAPSKLIAVGLNFFKFRPDASGKGSFRAMSPV